MAATSILNGRHSGVLILNICIRTMKTTIQISSTTSRTSSRILHVWLRWCRMFTFVFVRSPGAWMLPFAKLLVQQSIALARDAHLQLVRKHAYDTTFPFEAPAKLLQRLLNSVMSDRSGAKKAITYYTGNQLFRCYFRVKSILTAKSNVRWTTIECVKWFLILYQSRLLTERL